MENLPGWFLPAIVALFGSAVGSFANVVIHRVPSGASVVKPPSACPSCGHQLGWWENVPVISYVALRGKCRSCKSRISMRYPLVEAMVVLLWVSMALRFGYSLELLPYLALVSALVMLSAVDLEHRRLPNKVLVPAFAISLALFAVAAFPDGWLDLARAALGSLSFGLPMLAVGLLVPKGMGMGDIKLAAYLGLHLGWLSLLTVAAGAFIGFFSGAAAGVGMILARKKSRKDALPFGPFLSLGAIVAVLFGDQIVRVWLG